MAAAICSCAAPASAVSTRGCGRPAHYIYVRKLFASAPPGDQKGGPEVLVTEVKQPDLPLVDGFVAGEPPCLMLWRLRLPMVQVRLEGGLGALAHRITVSQNECANDAD